MVLTILKNHRLRQWGWDDIPYMKWKIKVMFETTNQRWSSIIQESTESAHFLGENPATKIHRVSHVWLFLSNTCGILDVLLVKCSIRISGWRLIAVKSQCSFVQFSGWWLTYSSEKYESQLGLFFPICGKIIQMFQTTNQFLMVRSPYLTISQEFPWFHSLNHSMFAAFFKHHPQPYKGDAPPVMS